MKQSYRNGEEKHPILIGKVDAAMYSNKLSAAGSGNFPCCLKSLVRMENIENIPSSGPILKSFHISEKKGIGET